MPKCPECNKEARKINEVEDIDGTKFIIVYCYHCDERYEVKG
ncbi:MAG: hypothetical protein ACOC1X_03485 [Promethearchaeota archaeon]